jgi:transcriptional regulator with XRE-family HTH domain
MMSPEQMAEKLGVNVETLRDWEQDIQEPRANRLAMIAGLLNVSLQWLLTGTGAGLDQPLERNSELEAALDIVTEIQVVRQDVATQLDRLAELEVRLRTALKDGA